MQAREGVGRLLGGDGAADLGDAALGFDDSLLQHAAGVGGHRDVVAQVHDREAEAAAHAEDDQRGDEELGGEGAGKTGVHGGRAGGRRNREVGAVESL